MDVPCCPGGGDGGNRIAGDAPGTIAGVAGRRRAAIGLVVVVLGGCSGGGGGSSAPAATGFAPPEVTATRTLASRSIIEPDAIAGLPLGASKDQAAAVLGPATTTTSDRDSVGRYETLHWQLSGNKGLALSFRAGSRYSPGLTDWAADVRGPATSAGVQVGDQADKVIEAYGPLADFCCASKAAVVDRGAGRLIVLVLNNTRLTDRIIGGDSSAWMRTVQD